MSGFFVYKITNRVNGKAYIGVTEKSVARRWMEHKREANRGKIRYSIYKAMRKYGIDNFYIETLYEASSRAEMIACERGLIAAHGTFGKSGYNLTSGGEGCRDMVVTEEFRQKISKLRKGAKMPRDSVERQKASWRIWAETPEGKESLSRRMKGKIRSQADRDLRSVAIKKHWVKRREKIRAENNVIDLFPDKGEAA